MFTLNMFISTGMPVRQYTANFQNNVRDSLEGKPTFILSGVVDIDGHHSL